MNTIVEAAELLAPLNSLLAEWPAGFKDHVSERICAGKPNARTLNSLLGHWYIRLRKLCQGSALEPFLKIVLEVVAQEFEDVLGLDASVYLAATTVEHLRLSDAARLTGASRNQLLRVIKQGEISCRTLLLGTRGAVYEIPKAEAKRIAKERLKWIQNRETENRAGVGEVVLRSMAEANVIKFDAQWRTDILKAGSVEAKSIDDLHAILLRNVKSVDIVDEKIIYWSELMSRRWGSNSAIRSVMQAAMRGDVRAVVQGANIGKMGFLRSDIAQYFGVPVLESGMSLTYLSEITGWKTESIRHWMNLDLLKSEKVKLPGQQRNVILPEHLLEFRESYIPLADLAKIMNTKASALARNLKGAVEIFGALSLPNGLSRGGLLRLADLGELAVAQAMVMRE